MARYKKLLSEITIKRMTIKNRIVMPPMGTNFANMDGTISDDHIKYYEQRAKGGTGMIILENSCVDYPMGTNGTTQLRIDDDQFIPRLYKFNEVMHAYDTRTCVQINHAGASAYAGRLNGVQQVSSSDVPSKKGGAIPRPLEKDEILDIVKKYGAAAKRAQQAGFDCIEIHAGHSYLLSQFLSPIYNKRTDEFGGSSENRARLTKLVVEEIRKQVGPFFPISLRISADELLEGGNTLEDSLELVSYFIDEVDMLNVSAALNDSLQYQIDQMNLKDGWRSYMAKAFKERYPKKVIMTSGNIRNPEIAEEILENNDADLIIIGRGLIAEPEWVNKVRDGKESLLRKCISCNIGCADHRIAKCRPLRCTVNPDVINNEEYKENKVSKSMKMVVIGGGTTALEAACTAAELGVDVELYEQKSYLGGLAHKIARFPDKKRIDDFVYYLEERVKQLPNLKINMNTKATIEMIKDNNADIILNTSGALPLLPPINGLHDNLNKENRKVFTIFDLLSDFNKFTDIENKEVVIVGGGAVGLDVAEYFANNKAKSISVIEMQSELGKDLDHITKLSMNTFNREHGVRELVNTALKEVQDGSFVIEKDGVVNKIPFDYGFVCLGMKANAPMIDELKEYCDSENKTLVNYGDSRIARRIFEGTNEARGIINIIKDVEINKLQ